jgi:hypothetical protein
MAAWTSKVRNSSVQTSQSRTLKTARRATGAPFSLDKPPYMDDRSTPGAVISSYYDAINRSEYARAYSYFGKDAAPKYDAWEMGYSDTGHVDVSFGQMAQEGAAGSIYNTLPVQLDVTSTEASSIGTIPAAISCAWLSRRTRPHRSRASISRAPTSGRLRADQGSLRPNATEI